MLTKASGTPEQGISVAAGSAMAGSEAEAAVPPAVVRHAADSHIPPQSRTLKEARAKYVLKNRRQPPARFDAWYRRAVEKQCFIDEYDQISRDLAAFHQLGTKEFVKRLDAVGTSPNRMFTYDSSRTADGSNGGSWDAMLRKIADNLPHARFYFNGLDEPRVLYNTQSEHSVESELGFSKAAVEWISLPRGQHEAFLRKHCVVHNAEKPLEVLNDQHGFLIEPDTWLYTTDLVPVMSHTRITPCFSDIHVPSSYYYPRAAAPAKDKMVPWHKRKPQVFWRGSSTGGHAYKDNWHRMHRQRMANIAKKRPELFDIAITAFIQCDKEECDAMHNEFGDSPRVPADASEQYKYVIDIDGNTFSGRYLRLLMSGSLVFKMTIFSEFFDDWLVPYKHYIPVQPDLSDFEQQVEWAVQNDDLAREIAESGRKFVMERITNEQMECYMELLLLELARLGGAE
nr:F-actin-capping protein subunit beta [Polyrhizophydium stewartii]